MSYYSEGENDEYEDNVEETDNLNEDWNDYASTEMEAITN